MKLPEQPLNTPRLWQQLLIWLGFIFMLYAGYQVVIFGSLSVTIAIWLAITATGLLFAHMNFRATLRTYRGGLRARHYLRDKDIIYLQSQLDASRSDAELQTVYLLIGILILVTSSTHPVFTLSGFLFRVGMVTAALITSRNTLRKWLARKSIEAEAEARKVKN